MNVLNRKGIPGIFQRYTFYIFYRLEAILSKYCPNNGCREFFRNSSDLKKHMDYHRHLAENEKQIPHIDNQGEITINRRIFRTSRITKIILLLQMALYSIMPTAKLGNVKFAIKKLVNMTGRK